MANPILERAAEIYSGQRSSHIEVPEWPDNDGKPTVVYFNRVAFRDRAKYFRKHNQNDINYLIDAIIDRARTGPDQNAPKMFTEDDRHILATGVDPDVVMRIGNEIVKGLDADVKAASGN